MTDDPLFYLLAVPAILVVGIFKGGLGRLLGMLSGFTIYLGTYLHRRVNDG